MRLPVKLHTRNLPAALYGMLHGVPDPRMILDDTTEADLFTEVVGSFKIGAIFKTTRYNRFPETLDALKAMKFERPPTILDVAVSDGSTSVAIINALDFRRYYLTDRCLDVFVERSDKGTLFLDCSGEPMFLVGDWFVTYADTPGAIWPLRHISKAWIATALRTRRGSRSTASLINPRIRQMSDPRVLVRKHDVMTAWPEEAVDMVIAANIFNRAYFADDRIAHGLRNLRNAMNEGGVLAIIENRTLEQSSIFRLLNGRFVLEKAVGAGSDIQSLIEGLA